MLRLLLVMMAIIMMACNTIDTTIDDIIFDELEVTETQNGGAVFNYRWGIDRITWSYEPSADYPDLVSDIDFALNLWQDHTAAFLFEYVGEHNLDANLYFVNVVDEEGVAEAKQMNQCGFLDKDSKIRAFSCLGTDMPGRELQTDDQIKVFIASEARGREIKLVLAHETGHAIGLAHTVSCDFEDKPIMYSGSNPCGSSSTLYSIHFTDIEALQAQYAD